MKKIVTKLIILLGGIIMIISCDDMNDIQSKYANLEERVYLGKVDSIKVYPGLRRVKLTWFVSADPKIEKTIIYWNMRNDSIVKDFNRSASGVQKDSIIIDSLPEGSTLFEFRNVSKKGESSLYSSTTAEIWGTSFADKLYFRRITSQDFNYEESTLKIDFTPVSEGDSVIYSKIYYTTQQGEERTIRIDRDENTVTLFDFADGQELYYQTAFFISNGIDTIFNNPQISKSPLAKFENGEKISLVGNLDSRYFERSGSLYEWNSNGDIIVYAQDEDGMFYQQEIFSLLVPRSTFRDFFFYDDNKFIGIRTNNTVSMHQIVEGDLITVKTPSGGDTFGSSYTMEKFLPAKGFFFSLKGGTLSVHPANNNATWGSPQTTAVGTGLTFDPIILYNYKSLLGVDTAGYLYSIPINTSGIPSSKSTIGSGWNKFINMVCVGNKLLCLDNNGDFYQFEFNTTDYYWIIE